MVLPHTTEVQHEVPSMVQNLQIKYEDIFSEPNTVPPHRHFDRAIALLPHIAPVHSRPYRYAPHQKDEI